MPQSIEDMRLDYHYFKSHGICTQCRVKDAVNGRSRCPECAEKARIVAKKIKARETPEKRSKRYKYDAEWKNRRREKRRSLGLCSDCGGHREDASYLMCLMCRLNKRVLILDVDKKHVVPPIPRFERHLYGCCVICNKSPLFKETKICIDCYNRNLISLAKAREVQKKNPNSFQRYHRKLMAYCAFGAKRKLPQVAGVTP